LLSRTILSIHNVHGGVGRYSQCSWRCR